MQAKSMFWFDAGKIENKWILDKADLFNMNYKIGHDLHV